MRQLPLVCLSTMTGLLLAKIVPLVLSLRPPRRSYSYVSPSNVAQLFFLSFFFFLSTKLCDLLRFMRLLSLHLLISQYRFHLLLPHTFIHHLCCLLHFHLQLPPQRRPPAAQPALSLAVAEIDFLVSVDFFLSYMSAHASISMNMCSICRIGTISSM